MIAATKRPVPSTHLTSFFSTKTSIPQNPITTSLKEDHKNLCFTLADELFTKGHIPSAQGIIDRLIKHSRSHTDAFSTIDFATSKGIGYNSSIVLQKLLDLNKPHIAQEVFEQVFLGRVSPNKIRGELKWAPLGFSSQVGLRAWTFSGKTNGAVT